MKEKLSSWNGQSLPIFEPTYLRHSTQSHIDTLTMLFTFKVFIIAVFFFAVQLHQSVMQQGYKEQCG